MNDSGACLALINWYSVVRRVEGSTVSRGAVVKAVGAEASPEAANARLSELPLKAINPFRFIGIFPMSFEIVEWCWDLRRLRQSNHTWKTRQWASSGFHEATAQRLRGMAFRDALHQPSAGHLDWLRRLHRSHRPEAGPFSTCMHRADAATVSYTEISVSSRAATMRYHMGTPCAHSTPFREHIGLRLYPSRVELS